MILYSVLIYGLFFYCTAFGQDRINEGVIINHDTAYNTIKGSLLTDDYVEYYPVCPKIIGHYKNGIKTGEFRYFNKRENGQYPIDSIVHYKLGKKNGVALSYFKSTKELLRSKEYYVNDLLEGECNYWYNDGQLRLTRTYKNGHILSEHYFPSVFITFQNARNDTIRRRDIQNLDSLKLIIIGANYNDGTTPVTYSNLSNEGYKIKSLSLISTVDQFMPLKSDILDSTAIKLILRSYRVILDEPYIENNQHQTFQVTFSTFNIVD